MFESLIAALVYSVATEEYDRSFDGYWRNGTWIPVVGPYEIRATPSRYALKLRKNCTSNFGNEWLESLHRVSLWSYESQISELREIEQRYGASVRKMITGSDEELTVVEPRASGLYGPVIRKRLGMEEE